ncbi:MAG: argininosuccinate lyase [Spirochaetaceae bacterium]|jgi:argininosuccinate lyase|nr:argininosuccinate lyase [Spirochaetaceae bacterium]
MGRTQKLWQGRFAETPDEDAVAFETSIFVDRRLALDDIAGSIAHVEMLGNTGVIPEGDGARIIEALGAIRDDLESGALQVDGTSEDIHSFIENELTARIGDAGKKLHTGRSRNDQIALDERLYLRRTIPALQGKIITLMETLTAIAGNHRFTLMPGYTHLQRAQPVTLAHHLCAWAEMLRRDWERLGDARSRMNLSPLGSGALAASSLPLDREETARRLGFGGVTANSLDAVADRDYCIETLSALALTMTHLSRFCEEVVLWSTEEFGFIALSERWSTGSSIMPQKKNPDFAELIRGRTGRVYGSLVALLTVMKGLPLSYNRDMQEDKQSLFDACDIVSDCLTVFAAMIGSAAWRVDRMRAACSGGFGNATDLAEYLVRRGMPFREAHGVAAGIVRLCIEKNCPIEDLPLGDLRAASPLIEGDVYDKLRPESCVEARDLPGGPAPRRTEEHIAALRDFCARSRQGGS